MRPLLFFCVALTALSLGCQSAQMPLSEALATTERLPVEGRQGWKIKETLRFGDVQVSAIDRSWMRGGDLVANELELNKRNQHYSFELREDDANSWQVACEARLRTGSIEGMGGIKVAFHDQLRLDCTLRPKGYVDQPWTLSVRGEQERPLEGTLRSREGTWNVVGTQKLKGGLPAEKTSGYEILAGTRPVAAVEVVGDGAVWLPHGLADQRLAFAATAAALLLLEDLHARLPRAMATT